MKPSGPLSALVVWLAFSGCTCVSIAGEGAELRSSAGELARQRWMTLPSGTRVELTSVKLDRVLAEPEHRPPRLIFTADVEGRVAAPGGESGPILVSALGVERVSMQGGSGGYRPMGPQLPALAGALTALLAREASGGQPGLLEALCTPENDQRQRLHGPPLPLPRAGSWLIRLEPDRVQVTEIEVGGLRLSSTLVNRDGRYLFASGLLPE